MRLSEQYGKEYCAELERWLLGAGEDALSCAYELGRRARADGLGILDVISLHHEAALKLFRTERAAEPAVFLRTVSSFLIEALSPFEMSYRAVDEANTALRHFNELLEAEAKRIAHALHDQAASIVASASLELDLAVGELPPGAQEKLACVRRLLDETGDQLRHLSHELRPTILDDLGLRRALDFLAEGFERRTGLRVEVSGPLRERYPPAVEIAVYRIAQEALNNAFLHGGEALMVSISLERLETELRCVIVDDGTGFDVGAVLVDGAKRGLGLLGMRERASAVAGTCAIHSAPGEGTAIEIQVPLGGVASAKG